MATGSRIIDGSYSGIKKPGYPLGRNKQSFYRPVWGTAAEKKAEDFLQLPLSALTLPTHQSCRNVPAGEQESRAKYSQRVLPPNVLSPENLNHCATPSPVNVWKNQGGLKCDSTEQSSFPSQEKEIKSFGLLKNTQLRVPFSGGAVRPFSWSEPYGSQKDSVPGRRGGMNQHTRPSLYPLPFHHRPLESKWEERSEAEKRSVGCAQKEEPLVVQEKSDDPPLARKVCDGHCSKGYVESAPVEQLRSHHQVAQQFPLPTCAEKDRLSHRLAVVEKSAAEEQTTTSWRKEEGRKEWVISPSQSSFVERGNYPYLIFSQDTKGQPSTCSNDTILKIKSSQRLLPFATERRESSGSSKPNTTTTRFLQPQQCGNQRTLEKTAQLILSTGSTVQNHDNALENNGEKFESNKSFTFPRWAKIVSSPGETPALSCEEPPSAPKLLSNFVPKSPGALELGCVQSSAGAHFRRPFSDTIYHSHFPSRKVVDHPERNGFPQVSSRPTQNEPVDHKVFQSEGNSQREFQEQLDFPEERGANGGTPGNFPNPQRLIPPQVSKRPVQNELQKSCKLPKLVAASLMCYSVAPETGDVYFLLGKEKDDPSWRQGSNRWSDFGGCIQNGETVFETAAREFLEETMGAVAYDDRDCTTDEQFSVRTSWRDIATALEAGAYTFRVDMKMRTSSPDATPRMHVCFVKRVPWNPAVVERFKTLRSALLELRRREEDMLALVGKIPVDAPYAYGLPTDREFKVNAIKCTALHVESIESIESVDPVEPHRPYAGDGFPKERLCFSSAKPDDRLMVLGITVQPYQKNSGGPEHIELVVPKCVAVESYLRYISLYRDTMHLFNGLPADVKSHPALKVTYVGEDPIWISVRPDFVEKQCVRWWSKPRLEHLVRNGGFFRGEYGRPCFLPTIAVVLRTINATAAKEPADNDIRTF